MMNDEASCKNSVGSRLGELALGHTVNTLVLGYAFDYALYPVVVWKPGLLLGGGMRALLSLACCLLALWFYEWSKRDWLGIEAVKHLRDGEERARWRAAAGFQKAMKKRSFSHCEKCSDNRSSPVT